MTATWVTRAEASRTVNGIWWPLAGVTAAIFALMYALNVVGDLLRDALDPKLIDE